MTRRAANNYGCLIPMAVILGLYVAAAACAPFFL